MKTAVKQRPESLAGPSEPRRGSKEAVVLSAGKWVGPPGELDRLLAEVEAAREGDLAFDKDRRL